MNLTSPVMASRPRYRRRNSYRLKGYDYSQPGAYFVTANCINKEHLFGTVINHRMILSEFGKIAKDQWILTPTIRPNVELGEFVVMPDHIHGIIIITERFADLNGVRGNTHPLSSVSSKLISTSQTLGAIMRGYMGAVTSKINLIRGAPDAKVWQRNFHDHIIRNYSSFKSISKYILRNPLKWKGE